MIKSASLPPLVHAYGIGLKSKPSIQSMSYIIIISEYVWGYQFHELASLFASPSLLPSPSLGCCSGSFAMTFSNCDHRASTEENSLPTCVGENISPCAQFLAVSYVAMIGGGQSYRDDGLEGAIQLVDVGEDMLEALFIFSVSCSLLTWKRESHHCDFSDKFLSLLLEVGLLPAAGLGVGE